MMWKQTISALRLLILLTVVTGIAYPLAMTGAAQTLFSEQANGSLVYINDKPVGSSLLGQNFTAAMYFHGRPSSAGADGYDAAGSSGSNLGPTSKKLEDTLKSNIEEIRNENQIAESFPIPSDFVTASASGLDPDISPESAYLQIKRIASERGITENEIRELVTSHIQNRQFGLLGTERVNVLALNMALDRLASK
jgi:K+-transporting ATPase ATPase C chain